MKKIKSFLLFVLVVFLIFVIVTKVIIPNKEKIKAYIEEFIVELKGNHEHKEPIIVSDQVQIHFLELGNSYSGDCVYIKADKYDILIDAGSRSSSASTIEEYVDQFCEDKILEYVIVTHAHQDHVAGFVDTKTTQGIFSYYEVQNIIDYSRRNSTAQIAIDYETARDKEVSLGAKHYTALDCIEGTNGGKKVFELTDTISLEILNQKYYTSKASSENDYSVCVMLNHGDEHFLFTGDLEESGEKSLVELNNLPKVKVYKGGHHGSKTSSSEELLSVIQPEIVCVCTCAGSSEYTYLTDNMFITQETINRLAVYTDKIYLTSVATYVVDISTTSSKGIEKGEEYLKTTGFKSMNGDIVVTSNSDGVTVNCSNNNTILKDSEWFNSKITLNGITRPMRTWPSNGK